MGNCQAAEAATVVIQHPSGKVERAYWSLTASQVMASNPGHYVAVIITSNAKSTGNSDSNSKAPVRYLKLLRPDDTLLVGHAYRLVSFEEVLREFGSKKRVNLSRLLAKQEESSGKRETRERRGAGRGGDNSNPEDSSAMVGEREQQEEVHGIGSTGRSGGTALSRHGQWRPTLQSIAEVGN